MGNGSGKLSDQQHTEKKYIFPDRDNYIEYQRLLLAVRDYFLHWYPFDYQSFLRAKIYVKLFIQYIMIYFNVIVGFYPTRTSR